MRMGSTPGFAPDPERYAGGWGLGGVWGLGAGFNEMAFLSRTRMEPPTRCSVSLLALHLISR